eukprot:2754274-Rhodomonas_salina.3
MFDPTPDTLPPSARNATMAETRIQTPTIKFVSLSTRRSTNCTALRKQVQVALTRQLVVEKGVVGGVTAVQQHLETVLVRSNGTGWAVAIRIVSTKGAERLIFLDFAMSFCSPQQRVANKRQNIIDNQYCVHSYRVLIGEVYV